MKKIINFCKKNYIAVISVLAAILLVIGSILIIHLINAHKNKIALSETNQNLYYYVASAKISNNYKIKYENNKIVSVKNANNSIRDNAITYYDDAKHVILPAKSMIVFPNANIPYKSLEKYSEIYKLNNSDIVVNNGKKISSYDFFIYDGNNLYFFPYEVTVTINDQTFNLSEYSYVSVNPVSATVYDYATDTVTYIENKITGAIATCDKYKVDLYNNAYAKNNDSYTLKVDIDYIETYKEA